MEIFSNGRSETKAKRVTVSFKRVSNQELYKHEKIFFENFLDIMNILNVTWETIKVPFEAK